MESNSQRRHYLLILFLVFSCFPKFSFAESQEYVLAYLKDKSENSKPQFSIHAQVRRYLQEIESDWYDIPVNKGYIDSLKNNGLNVAGVSRWLNAVLILCENDEKKEQLSKMSFVSRISYLGGKGEMTGGTQMHAFSKTRSSVKSLDKDIGKMRDLIGLTALHEMGYLGDGVHIAVIDAGFPGVDTIIPFKKQLMEKDWLLGTRDFFNPGRSVDRGLGHGTSVLSVMTGRVTLWRKGAAHHAKYWLLASEDEINETPVEEFRLVEALEFADSAGVWVTNISLGYNQFDVEQFNYSAQQLDGNTSISSRAASIASKKGMLVVTSAGNSGQDDWKYIGFPADADGVLSVGATKMNGKPAAFSSFASPVAKYTTPRIAAPGVKVPVAAPDNNIMIAQGTSFASPLIASAAACLWQAFPAAKAQEIISSIESSTSGKGNIDPQLGYGIPDMTKAQEVLSKSYSDARSGFLKVLPGESLVAIAYLPKANASYTLIVKNEDKATVFSKVYTITSSQLIIIQDASWGILSSGKYTLEMTSNDMNLTTEGIIH